MFRTAYDKVLMMMNSDKFYDEPVTNYLLEESFDDLLRRKDSLRDDEICNLIFCGFINLPLVVSDKIFSVLNTSKTGYLSREEFTNGIYNLYYNPSFENMLLITFKIFKSYDDIYPEDVKLFFYHLIQEDKIKNLIDKAVNRFFGSSLMLNFIEYKHKIENTNSNIFILLIVYLYIKRPFNQEALNFYWENRKEYLLRHHINFVKKENFTDNTKYISFPPTEIVKLFKYVTKISSPKRKYAKTNVLDFCNNIVEKFSNDFSNNKTESKISSYNQKNCFSNKLCSNNSTNQTNNNPSNISSTVSTMASDESLDLNKFLDKSHYNKLLNSPIQQSKSELDISSFISNENLKENVRNSTICDFEFHTFKTRSDLVMIKTKVCVLDNVIFSFDYSEKDEKLYLSTIKPLNGYHISTCENIKINNSNYFSLGMINQYSNSMANLNNIFFFNNKEERDDVFEKILHLNRDRLFEDCYELENQIGQGNFGTVFSAIDKFTKKRVAIKIINRRDINDEKSVMMVKEINILKFLINYKHPNLIDPIEILEDSSKIYIVMEFIESTCTLKSYLKFIKNEMEIREIAKQIISGMEFITTYGIIHRDLKPENILITKSNKQIKIIDFGMSDTNCFNEPFYQSYGSLLYCPPEILQGRPYTNKIDVWSFGIILFEMCTGLTPFYNEKKEAANRVILSNKICYQEIILDENFNYSGGLREVIYSCLDKNSKSRSSFKSLKKSAWLTKENRISN